MHIHKSQSYWIINYPSLSTHDNLMQQQKSKSRQQFQHNSDKAVLHECISDEMLKRPQKAWTVDELQTLINTKYKEKIINLTTHKKYKMVSKRSIVHSLSKKKYLFEKDRDGMWQIKLAGNTSNLDLLAELGESKLNSDKDTLTSRVKELVQKLGGLIPESQVNNIQNNQTGAQSEATSNVTNDTKSKDNSSSLPPSLQYFSKIIWNPHRRFKSKKYNVEDIIFDQEIEKVTFNPDEWKNNSWIKNHRTLYLLGDSTCILATIDVEDMTDFPIYMIWTDRVVGPVPLSEFLASLK